ncbi:MAG: NAD(P)H-hydrate epimerase, partial [Nocardioidaceae bacterium]
MLRAHSVDQVRRAEHALMATLPDGELMRRAAAGLAETLMPLVLGAERADLLMLVGVGDNGGDALYAAAELAGRGARVDLLVADEDRVHTEGLRAATRAGARRVERPGDQRVVVDAVVGIGGRPGLREPAAAWYDEVRGRGAHVVAVDVPSGVDVDGATLPAPHVEADLTCTFGTYKPALLVDPAASAAGPRTSRLVDIGLGPYLGEPVIEAIEAADTYLLRDLVRPMFTGTTHKYSRGVVGVAAGSAGYAGAAQLCVRGARAGPAGMVRYVGSDDLARRIVDRCPDVVAHTDPADRGRVQAWVVGPGGDDDAEHALRMALDDGVPVVVD